MPETYIVDLDGRPHSKRVLAHKELQEFLKVYTKDSWWIIKPGESSNRGTGIRVLDNIANIKYVLLYEMNAGAK